MGVTITVNTVYGVEFMDNAQLGKRLKEARLAKKMTQSDVVGSFITRNMLSQIESGAAYPSLRTLEYLANTLGLPIHYLVEEEGGTGGNSSAVLRSGSGGVHDDGDFVQVPRELFERVQAAHLKGDFGLHAPREAYAGALRLLDEMMNC